MVVPYFFVPKGLYLFLFFSFLLSCVGTDQKQAELSIPQRVNELMAKMTLKEKIGQMNQYNGFWNVTGPSPKDGNAKEKYDHLAKGLVGSMLNVRGAREVRAVQEVAVNQ